MPPKKRDEKKEEGNDVQPTEDSGAFVFPDGARYKGQFVRREGGNIKRQGQGSYNDSGVEYEGGWKDDMMCGDCSISFPSGSKYVGSIVDNAFDGRGVFTWPDGSSYDGQWRYNRMHGEGAYCDAEGRLWNGRFYNGTGPGLRQHHAAQAEGALPARLSASA
jgi:hypothetical protein